MGLLLQLVLSNFASVDYPLLRRMAMVLVTPCTVTPLTSVTDEPTVWCVWGELPTHELWPLAWMTHWQLVVAMASTKVGEPHPSPIHFSMLHRGRDHYHLPTPAGQWLRENCRPTYLPGPTGALGVNQASIPQKPDYAYVPRRTCTQLDGVHPSARECATDNATVQGHSEHSVVCDSRRYKQWEWHVCSFALDTGFSNLPQLNKAEAYLDANNVVYFTKTTGNSGLPLRWQGRLLTNWRRVRCGNIGLDQVCECKTLQVVNLKHMRSQVSTRFLFMRPGFKTS